MAARKQKKNERTVKTKGVVQKRQEENKAKFIAKLRETPIIQVAAAQVGIHRDTYYEWRNSDPQFKEDCFDALKLGDEFVNDMMESLLIKSAKEGKITAMIFWLKNHHHQYNDKRYHEHEHYFRDDLPLTEERKAQIMAVMEAWNAPDDEDDTDRDEDYEVQKDEEGNIIDPTVKRPPRWDADGNMIM